MVDTVIAETEETEIMTVITVTEETMIAIVGKEETGTETMTADADQIAVIPDWIPDLLFLLRDREHAVVKDHRKMTDVIWRNVRGISPAHFL